MWREAARSAGERLEVEGNEWAAKVGELERVVEGWRGREEGWGRERSEYEVRIGALNEEWSVLQAELTMVETRLREREGEWEGERGLL